MRWKYITKLLSKAIVFLGLVIFIYGVIFDASSSDSYEALSTKNTVRLEVGERFQGGNVTDSKLTSSSFNIESEEDDNRPYLTSAEVELEGPKPDQKMLRYNERYWDIAAPNYKNASFQSKTTESVMYNDLDNLWRPTKGQPEAEGNDRIVQQLVWVMEAANSSFSNRIKEKRILMWDTFGWWSKPAWVNGHSREILQSDCPTTPASVGRCLFTDDKSDLTLADAVVTTQEVIVPEHVLKIIYNLESPFRTRAILNRRNDLLATYWRGSDIVTPYAKWVYYDLSKKVKPQGGRNYASGKTKPVAIFVSNCRAWNNRKGYIEELGQSIKVDVYGSCGTLSCARSDEQTCFEMLQKDYYFYLSFENSNCRDYITEKLYMNGLQNDVIPVVMGAHPDDYKAIAPYKSYIHIEEFDDPKELAGYMNFLIDNPIKYNEYFKWKGTGEFINTESFCRFCAMAHYADFKPPPKREKQYRWGIPDSFADGMCLDNDVWYWTKSVK